MNTEEQLAALQLTDEERLESPDPTLIPEKVDPKNEDSAPRKRTFKLSYINAGEQAAKVQTHRQVPQ